MEKSYRIHTNISSDTVLNVNMKQDFDFLEVLTLKLAQKDAYKIHSSNYGVIVGRILANDAFGIPNAKVSVFIERDTTDTTEIENIYPYKDVTTKDRNNIRYNLLPDYSDDECYRIVGTFPNKRLLLDDDTYLEVYEKYWKYTTVTNKAGDYMIFGVPTGSQQVHTDIDLSDIGILSQKPRDFIYKGYNITEFDNANQFKESTNLDNLRQIISQDKSVFVYPFWGDINNVIAAITRCDMQVDYKFEPTCIFMGSIVSDNDANAIGHKCAPEEENGMNRQLVAGEGTIEMIRKTVDGLVEEYQIQGNRLIDSDGVWCYQIPMNLDYIGTDEYGNIVPTDNPNKGIPTRTQVRFRFSKTETGEEGTSRHTAKYLVPMNPLLEEDETNSTIPKSKVSGAEFEKLYNFGSNTPQSCFRDLYWNNVYSVKNYIPKVQVAHRAYSENYGALKAGNIVDNQNSVPFNSIHIDIPFMYMIVCILFTIVMAIVIFINTLVCLLDGIIQLFNGLFDALKDAWLIGSLFSWLPSIPYIPCVALSPGLTEGNILYLPGCDCSRGQNAHDCPDDMPHCSKSSSSSKLLEKVQQNLAMQYNVVRLDLHQDWINGCLYMPLWFWLKRKKKTFLFGLFSSSAKNEFCDCDKRYSRLKTYVTCDIPYTNQSLEISPNTYKDGSIDRWHKNQSEQVRYQNGLIKGVKNKDGLTVYYYVAMQPTDVGEYELITNRPAGFEAIRLYATDIILLGNINEDNLYGIPQLFKVLPSTTANIPPIASIEEAQSDEDEKVPQYDTSEREDVGTTIITGMDWGIDADEETPNYRTGLFLDLGCTYAETRLKSCINAERLAELGVNLDMTHNMSYSNGGNGIQTGLIDSDGFITKYELEDMNNRSMFATLNHIGFVPQTYLDEIGAKYTTQVEDENTTYLVPKFKYIFPTDFDGRMQGPMNEYKANFEQAMYDEQDEAYLTFRFGAENPNTLGKYHGRVRHFYHASPSEYHMPLYNNSFYFYFGINKGNTAIDKFNNMFLAECVQNNKEPFSVDVDSKGKSYCSCPYQTQPEYDFKKDSYAYIKVALDDIQTPFSYSLYDSVGNLVVGENNMTVTTFTIGDINDNGKVKYQLPIDDDGNPETPKIYEAVENDYGISGLTNQIYNLTIIDDNGKKVSRRIELDMPKMSFNYTTYRLGTKFYNTKASKMSYICDEESDLYGRIVLNDFSVDGMNCDLDMEIGSDVLVISYNPDNDDFIIFIKLKKEVKLDGRNVTKFQTSEMDDNCYVYLTIKSLESEHIGDIKKCFCGGESPRIKIGGDDENGKYIQIDVYQPNRYIVSMYQVCDGKLILDNSHSEIVRVFNGENFNTFLNEMPTKFMLGTSNDDKDATISNTSYFYSSTQIRNATDRHICGWFGVHQEDSYQFSRPELQTRSENQVIWEDFINFKSNNITTPYSKSLIIAFKFRKMFSLSDAVYSSYDFVFRAVGGVQPILYRSVVPLYGDSKKASNRYKLSDVNTASVPKEYPQIIGNNYMGGAGARDGVNNPRFNTESEGSYPHGYYNTRLVGNYFAAFTNNGGYKDRKNLDPNMLALRSPSFASVSPMNGNLKEIGKDYEKEISSFSYVYEKDQQQLDGDKSRTTQPYLRAMAVDRKLDYDLLFLGPVVGSNFSLYENPTISETTYDKDRTWKGARIQGTVYGGIEMSYDADYNIISADTNYDESGNVISASSNKLLEYSYVIPEMDGDAHTIYNKPSNVFWERDLEDTAYTPSSDSTMNRRFYEAELCGVDIRDYFWSTFNKRKLDEYITNEQGLGLEKLRATPIPYIFQYPYQQVEKYNGDFNRDDAIRPNNYPTKRYIDVCNIIPMNDYNFKLTSCSYANSQVAINDDGTITNEINGGESLELDLDFDKIINFREPSSNNNTVGNIEYRINGVSNGYNIFVAKSANIIFTINTKSVNGFSIYNSLPKLIRALPYTKIGTVEVDGITYIKTTTPNGELCGNRTIDDAINNTSFFNFSGEHKWSLFGGGGDVVIQEEGYRFRAVGDGFPIVHERLLWYDPEERFVSADEAACENIIYSKTISDFSSIKAFSVLLKRTYLSNSETLINKIKTLEFSEIIDTRNILLKFTNKGLDDEIVSYVELRNLETDVETEEETEDETTPTEDTEEEVTESKVYIQGLAFEMCVNMTGDVSFEMSNQVFTNFSMMSFTFMFRRNGQEDEYYVQCNSVTVLSELDDKGYPLDGKLKLLFKMRWTQDMGIMCDDTCPSGRWRCYMLAKTNSGFSYKLGEFILQAQPQTMPTTPGVEGRIITNVQMMN